MSLAVLGVGAVLGAGSAVILSPTADPPVPSISSLASAGTITEQAQKHERALRRIRERGERMELQQRAIIDRLGEME